MTEVVAALIWDKNTFMICQRPPHKARGLLWEFAGGKVEPGETKEQALIRECREELGVTLSVGEPFMEVTHPYPDLTVHLTLFHATIADGVPQRREHYDIRWITPDEIPEYDFCPADAPMLQKIRQMVGTRGESGGEPEEFVSRVRIEKGWSDDRKYCVTDRGGTRYLLRVSPAERYEQKRRSFDMMRRVAALGVPMCQPVAFGRCADGVYSLQSWIDGEDAEAVIPSLPADAQYRYGEEAGRILRRIHSIPAPPDQEDWEVRFNRKADAKIQRYLACPIHCENGQAFIDYIRENRHLLGGRPQVYQHGDYHIGNMMVDRDGKLCIIDFDRDDFGDPWEEFNRIVWCAQKAPRFATGMVDGYFDGAVPPEFWQLLALYIASNELSSVSWAIPFGEREMNTMLKQAGEVLGWYDQMRRSVPSWYGRK